MWRRPLFALVGLLMVICVSAYAWGSGHSLPGSVSNRTVWPARSMEYHTHYLGQQAQAHNWRKLLSMTNLRRLYWRFVKLKERPMVLCLFVIIEYYMSYSDRKARERTWRKLSTIYRNVEQFDGRIEKCGWFNAGTNAEGLYLSTGTAKAPTGVFIPWNDVIISDKSSWLFGNKVVLQFNQVPDVTIALREWRVVPDQAEA